MITPSPSTTSSGREIIKLTNLQSAGMALSALTLCAWIGTVVARFIDKDWNRVSISASWEIESIKVGDGSMPYLSHDITRLTCDPDNKSLTVHEQWALFFPFYLDIIGNSGGEQKHSVPSCNLKDIKAIIDSLSWLRMTKYVLKNPSAYNIKLKK